MRRLFALTPLLLLAACSGAPDGPSSTATTFDGPDSMRAKVTSVLTLTECNSPTRDIDGVLYVECNDPTGGLVRMSTFDAGDSNVESLTANGWKVDGGETWNVGVNSDQATLDKVMAALRS